MSKTMKIKSTYAIVLLFILIGLCEQSYAQEITDLIQLVKISYGRVDTILVSDLFYAKTYDLKFDANSNIQISHNRNQNTVVFQPLNNFLGATLVGFTLGGAPYIFV